MSRWVDALLFGEADFVAATADLLQSR